MVGEPLMKRGQHRREHYIVTPVGKNHLQTLYLLVAVTEDIDLVTVRQKFGERLTDKLEIFVIYGLWGALEVD